VATRIELSRLGDDEIVAVAQNCLSTARLPGELSGFLAAHSDGLPFLAEELLAGLVADQVLVAEPDGTWSLTRELDSRVPPAFSEAVSRRMEMLSPAGVEVLHAAATLGRRFDWSLLVDATGRAADDIVAALRAAVGAQLVSVDADGFRFRHALTRDAVLDGLLPPDRARLASRLLGAVERAHPDLAGEWCELAAGLAEQAGESARSAELLLEAGQRAVTFGALDSADRILRHARSLVLDDPGSHDPGLVARIDEAHTEVLALAGRVDQAFEVGDRLLARLDLASRLPSGGVDLHLRLARAAVAAARWQVAADHLGVARASTGTGAGGLRARVNALDAQVALGTGRLDEAESLAAVALRDAERELLPAVACEALEVAGRVARQRDLQAAEADFTRELTTATAHGLHLWRLRALHELGTIDQLRTESVERLQQTRDLAVDLGAVALVATLDLQIAAGLLKQFRTGEALVFARRSVEASRRLGLATLPMALVLEATGYAQDGQAERMEGCLAEALALAPGDPDVLGSAWGHCRATVALLAEDRPRALAEMSRGARSLQASPASVAPPFLGLRVLLLAFDGEPSTVRTEAEQLRGSGATRRRVVKSLLRYADAVLLGRAGRGTEALSAFGDADDRMGDLVAWYRQYARRVVAESALENGWGEPVAWLREAAGFFADRGDRHPAAACRALLRRAGVAVPRAGRGRAEVPAVLRSLGVTSREVDVGQLVAEGLTNAQIGDRLFLSPRTIEKHVAALLDKTGCRGRAQLAGYWARLPG
jgi:DNA-binding CsgD family transcriptional regulator/tetratricopeptide (TPR) repeat protein